ncbi:MAG: hypothetical protein AB2563_06335 [Candidatus Thiodiazotropha endolucinida]
MTNMRGLLVTAPSLKSSVLIWHIGEPIPISLSLRLPRLPVGYSSILSIHSALGQQSFTGESLTKTTFARVALKVPPASLNSSPPDPALEFQVKAVLEEFRLTGNYFRVTVNGGVLENRNTPLELGREYFLVTQQQLPISSCPGSLEIIEVRTDRSWTAYHLKLRDDPTTREADLLDLRLYLEREIVPVRPKIDVVWPPPNRFDPDGTRIYDTEVSHLIILSNSGAPRCETIDSGRADITALSSNFYGIDFVNRTSEAVIWLQSGAQQRLRFESTQLVEPEGVRLRYGKETVDLYAKNAKELAKADGKIEILVPSERLWRRVRINNLPLKNLPNGNKYLTKGPLQDIEIGAFGNIQSLSIARADTVGSPWYSRFETLIVNIAGPTAFNQLSSAHTKHQLLRWATKHDALSLLPLMLSTYSAEVKRGIS